MSLIQVDTTGSHLPLLEHLRLSDPEIIFIVFLNVEEGSYSEQFLFIPYSVSQHSGMIISTFGMVKLCMLVFCCKEQKSAFMASIHK